MKIAQHAPLLADGVGRHPQRLADPIQQAQQIVGRAFGMPGEAAQIAEQHRHFGFARSQHHVGIAPFERFEHDGREELAEARPLPLQQPHVAQRTGGGGDQLGEFQIVAQVGRVGSFDCPARR